MKNKTVCIVGLGYVGLPLAEAFSRHLEVIGFDIDEEKIKTKR
jgi:UDP-N-acetyl-D-mannosaminuronate dehydrogenase